MAAAYAYAYVITVGNFTFRWAGWGVGGCGVGWGGVGWGGGGWGWWWWGSRGICVWSKQGGSGGGNYANAAVPPAQLQLPPPPRPCLPALPMCSVAFAEAFVIDGCTQGSVPQELAQAQALAVAQGAGGQFTAVAQASATAECLPVGGRKRALL